MMIESYSSKKYFLVNISVDRNNPNNVPIRYRSVSSRCLLSIYVSTKKVFISIYILSLGREKEENVHR